MTRQQSKRSTKLVPSQQPKSTSPQVNTTTTIVPNPIPVPPVPAPTVVASVADVNPTDASTRNKRWSRLIPKIISDRANIVANIIIAIVAFGALILSVCDHNNNAFRESQALAEKSYKHKQEVFECYLMSKQLWNVELAYVQYEDKTPISNAPPDVIQTIAIQQAQQTAHDLGCDVLPLLDKIYHSKKEKQTLALITAYQVQGIRATIDTLNERILLKYGPDGKAAYQAGSDVGFLLLLDKRFRDDSLDQNMRKKMEHRFPGMPTSTSALDTEMTGPMEEAARRLNAQASVWGMKTEFGFTRTYPPDDKTKKPWTVTLPNRDRHTELETFVDAIEEHLRPK